MQHKPCHRRCFCLASPSARDRRSDPFLLRSLSENRPRPFQPQGDRREGGGRPQGPRHGRARRGPRLPAPHERARLDGHGGRAAGGLRGELAASAAGARGRGRGELRHRPARGRVAGAAHPAPGARARPAGRGGGRQRRRGAGPGGEAAPVAEFESLRLSMRRADMAIRARAAAVAAGEARLRAVVDTAVDAIVVIDERGIDAVLQSRRRDHLRLRRRRGGRAGTCRC